jgi:HPt (histidine-containing phosphotransfer) domain-containing protein
MKTAVETGDDDLPALDLQRVAALRALRNGSLLAQLATGYSEQGRSEMMAIRAAIDEGRLQDGAAVAHSLKSSSLNIGAQLVGVICRRIEGDMLAGNSADLATLCRELEMAFERTVEDLRSLL